MFAINSNTPYSAVKTNENGDGKMKISEASKIIGDRVKAGLLSLEEAAWYHRMIRRTGGYGNKWSWKRQNEMRANLMSHFAK